MEELLYDACIDAPRDTDYSHDELFWSEWATVEKKQLNKTKAQNQWAQKETHYACTIYSMVHCSNEENFLEASKLGSSVDEMNAIDIVKDVVEADVWFNPTSGWSLQEAMDYFRKNNIIAGYAICKTLSDIKQAILSGRMVNTWSRSINWTETKRNGNIAVAGTSYWHAFCIEWFDDTRWVLICRNSYGEQQYDSGRFYVRYEDLWLLYTRYAIIDYSDKVIILGNKWKILGIWNGERPNDPVTRLELATILQRVSWKTVYDGSRWAELPTSYEKTIMGRRAFGVWFTWNTRIEAVAFAMRFYK